MKQRPQPALALVLVALAASAAALPLAGGCRQKAPATIARPETVPSTAPTSPPAVEPTSPPPPSEAATEVAKPKPEGKGGTVTPAKGSTQRTSMMDALRAYLKRQDLVFVVPRLQMKNGWAFASVAPETKDGKQHLEGLDVLWKGQGDTWSVKRVMGLNGEDDWAKYDAAGSVRKFWVKQYPQAPPAIFPDTAVSVP
jgi:hypothetical protein